MNIPKPKIVLIAIETLGGGGAERVAIDLARHWPKRQGVHPVLLVAENIGEYKQECDKTMPVLEIGIPSSPRKMLSFLSRLKRQVKPYDVQGVIVHMNGMSRMMMRAKLLGIIKAPVVVVEHTNYAALSAFPGQPLRRLLHRFESRFLYQRAKAVVGCSQGVAGNVAETLNLASHQVKTIINPLNRKFLRKLDSPSELKEWLQSLPRPLLINVGRLCQEKDHKTLMRAFAAFGRGSLVILGDGPMRLELELYARELDIDARVFMTGFSDISEAYMQSADLYVSTSIVEGYPLTLVEAYASGLPVVAKECDFGVSEIVTPNRPGQIVHSDRLDDLVKAMEQCLQQEPRFDVGTKVDLSMNDPERVAKDYYDLLGLPEVDQAINHLAQSTAETTGAIEPTHPMQQSQ